LPDNKDLILFQNISIFMKGRIDLEDVKNDPELSDIDNTVKVMILEYDKNKIKNKADEKFIRDIFAEEVSSDEKIIDEISHIKHEINSTGINDISAEWVKDWHEKRQKNMGSGDTKANEIKDFITRSLQSDLKPNEIDKPTERKKGMSRTLFVRYLSLSAAAFLGGFIILRTLLPTFNSESLFNSFYEPLDAISPTTRGVNSDESDSFISAIENYKLGKYQEASAGFSELIKKSNSAVAPRFFMGITQMALGNYDQSIIILNEISGSSVEFKKEATWYLGLAYLKTGEKERASTCFEMLVKTPGFYSERAKKILRRLK
jgi:tetratricopeptide (TPR) repeat protein